MNWQNITAKDLQKVVRKLDLERGASKRSAHPVWGDNSMKAVLLAVLFLLLLFGSLSATDLGGDITPPVLVAASAERLQIDTSDGPQTITFTLHVTDDLSGLNYVQISYIHRNGYNTNRNCDTWVQFDPSTDVTIPCAVNFPQFSAEGRWQVLAVFMEDRVGNPIEKRYSECGTWSDNRCLHYEYTDNANEVIRSMEIQIGTPVPGEDPLLYLPIVIH